MNKENKPKAKASSVSVQSAAQETTTITLLLKWDKDTVVTLYACIQPLEGYAGASPYAWFEDVHLKELVGVAQEVLQSTPAEELEGDKKPQHQLRRGENTRILFVFKDAASFPFHILVPSKSYSPDAVAPTVAFISEHGRRVLPFVEHSTRGGGFQLLRMHKCAICAYVDCYEADSPLGVFKIMKNLEVSTQPHLATEVVGGAQPGRDGDKSSAGKKAAAKRKKGQQTGTVKKPRSLGVVDQLAGTKNTILPFTKQHTKKEKEEGEVEGGPEEGGKGEEEPSEEMEATGMVEGKKETEAGEVEKGKALNGKSGSHQLKEKSCVSYVTPASTRYGLRSRRVPNSVVEPSPTEVELPQTPPRQTKPAEMLLGKDTSLDSGKAASQDTVVSSLPESCPGSEDKLSTGMSQDDKASVGTSQVESESIFSTTPLLPTKRAAGTTELTPMQVLVSHLHNDQDEDLQGYLSQQVDTEVSVVPDICVISDVEDGEEEAAAKPKKGRRRNVEVDPKKLFAGKSSLSQLTRVHLMRWMKANKPLIVLLFQGKEYSRRHNDFLAGIKKRAALHHQIDLRLFTHDQIQVIGKALMAIFCAKDMKYFGYVMSVIFPECLIRIIADFYQVDFSEAEEMMFNPQLAMERFKQTA